MFDLRKVWFFILLMSCEDTVESQKNNLGKNPTSNRGDVNRLIVDAAEKREAQSSRNPILRKENDKLPIKSEPLISVLNSIDGGEMTLEEGKDLIFSMIQSASLKEIETWVSIIGPRINSTVLPESAEAFIEAMVPYYRNRKNLPAGELLEALMVEGPFQGFLAMKVGRKLVSGDDPTRPLFELLDSDAKIEGVKVSFYYPLLWAAAKELNSQNMEIIGNVEVSKPDDFGAHVIRAVAKRLIAKSQNETVGYIMNLPDGTNREIAILEIAKLAVYLRDTEVAESWLRELKDENLRERLRAEVSSLEESDVNR